MTYRPLTLFGRLLAEETSFDDAVEHVRLRTIGHPLSAEEVTDKVNIMAALAKAEAKHAKRTKT